jgi:hypothetical protein
MPDIPRINMSSVGPVLGALWETAKASVPKKCYEMAGSGQRDEQVNFAKFGGPGGGGQPGAPSAGSHEMSNLGARKVSTASSDDFCGGESSQRGPNFKISEWQAAWNVTNAIQVKHFINNIK